MKGFFLAGAILLGTIVAAFGQAADPVNIILNGQEVSSGNPLPVTLSGAAFAAAGAAQPVLITYNGTPVSGSNPLPVSGIAAGCSPTGATAGYLYNNGSSGCSTSTTLTTSGGVDTESGTLSITGVLSATTGVVVSGTNSVTLSNNFVIEYLNPNARISLPSSESFYVYNQGRGTNLLLELNGATGAAIAPILNANGTTLPSLAAGNLLIAGAISAGATPGANEEGYLYLSSAGGINFVGKGSSADQTWWNGSGSVAFTIPTGTNSIQINGHGILSSPATATTQFGAADAASPVAQSLFVQNVVGGTSNTAGVNFTIQGSLSTGTGVGGAVIIAVAKTGSTGSTQNSSHPMITANAGSATGATVQFGDGTNFTTYDSCTALTTGSTGVIACTASALRFKHLLTDEWVTPEKASAGLDKLRIGAPVWRYDDQERFGVGSRVGLIANDVERMDRRCVTHDNDGQLKDYWDRCVIAYLVADRQQTKERLDRIIDSCHYAANDNFCRQLLRRVGER